LIVDGKTGKILHSHNQNVRVYPASLTKVMTLYMLFEALEAGKFALNDKLHVSPNATRAHPSKLHLKAGEQISVREAILALIVKSANDAAIVVAENIAGSEQKFAKLMNIRAKQLGMKNSFFTNASGWHHPAQKTTPIDLAKLSIAIKRDFPQYYGFFAKTSFKFKGKQINGHNRLTANYPGAEGLKTGFTNPAGCNLITVATRNGKTLVGVVTGSNKAIARDKKMASLLDKHFGIKNDNLKPKKAPKSRIKLASNKER
jgi:D-alanyl-D-alanine carboxypeptidase (penicillin-binding protein 5/6)